MPVELHPNTSLSHFRIVSKIGAGGMGEVYLAHVTKLDRKVAIKFPSEALNEDKLKRFYQEAKAASAICQSSFVMTDQWKRFLRRSPRFEGVGRWPACGRLTRALR